MSSVALIWIAVLHVFSLATASTAVRRDDTGGRFGAHYLETSTARWLGDTADVPVPDVRVPLRVPVRLAHAETWRLASPVTHGRSGGNTPLDHRRDPLVVTHDRPLRHQVASNAPRLDSRGTLLPYFPTAPPRRG